MRRTKVRQLDQLVPVFELLQQPFQVCFEASCGCGRIAEFLQRYAARVVVAHPGHLSLIFRSKRKHDRIDAEKLAKLLALDLVPAVHVPHADVRAWREAINFRSAQIAKRTRVKHERRKRWWRSSTRWIGSPTRRRWGAYVGLVPCQDQSGGPHRRGRITRDGAPVVRKLVMEAAWQGLRHSPTIRAYFDRIVAGGSTKSDKDRRKIALVATAHDLVRVMWAMLKNGTLRREQKAPPLSRQRSKRRRGTRLREQARPQTTRAAARALTAARTRVSQQTIQARDSLNELKS